MTERIFYTDGSCRGNPGPGGYGVIGLDIAYSQTMTEVIPRMSTWYAYRESQENTTNNRMELEAILHAAKFAKMLPAHKFIIYSDSAYAVKAINEWMRGWAANGWQNSKKKPVENQDLMKQLWEIFSDPKCNCQVIKCNGHSGEIGNELADALATNDYIKYSKIIDKYHIWDDVEDPFLKNK